MTFFSSIVLVAVSSVPPGASGQLLLLSDNQPEIGIQAATRKGQ